MTEMRDWLNGQGVRNTQGRKLTYNSVQHLLNNRRYIGEYVYREIIVPDGIPAIVPQDLFDRVQEKLAKNRKAPATRPRRNICSPPSCSAATAGPTSAARAAPAARESFTAITSVCP